MTMCFIIIIIILWFNLVSVSPRKNDADAFQALMLRWDALVGSLPASGTLPRPRAWRDVRRLTKRIRQAENEHPRTKTHGRLAQRKKHKYSRWGRPCNCHQPTMHSVHDRSGKNAANSAPPQRHLRRCDKMLNDRC